MFPVEKSFLLKLSEDKSWCFLTIEKELIPLLNKFASIVGLEDSSSRTCEANSLVFVSTQLDENKFKVLIQETNHLEENQLSSVQKICQKSSLLQLWLYQDKKKKYGIRLDSELDLENFSNEGMRSISIPIFLELQEAGGFPFHAALIELHGKGILLAAPSKTGKTTCCCRIPSPWTVLSDDTALITYDERKYKAHPFPTWSKFLSSDLRIERAFEYEQKKWDIKQNVNLDLILFLEQAKNDEVIFLNQTKSVSKIYQSAVQASYLRLVSRSKNGKLEQLINDEMKISLKQELFKNSCNLAKSIKTAVLHVSLDGRFWEKIEKVL